MVKLLDEMVVGLERFAEHFKDYQDRFVIIGGTACKVILEENAIETRGTKDIDIVLCLNTSDNIDAGFAKVLLDFIEEGKYSSRTRNDGVQEYYRFEKPEQHGYPVMLEFFSGKPGSFPLKDDQIKCRLVVEEDMMSLSAILLDDDYYRALIENKTIIRGLPFLNEELLIPFKARAHVDLSRKKAAGDANAKSSDINKHRADIIRLLALISPDKRLKMADSLRRDVGLFINKLYNEKFRVEGVVAGFTLDMVVEVLGRVYQVGRDEFPYLEE
ncbi:hypothetical protein [Thalassospira sp. A3_1]|uniref:hypothetical protein n=1 Tax=Thalassospira sp. A3_1 TaxID=2821088 RepID=UPI001AD9778E|nr:hypothetical protein [Thalassospira sp. A3_1]MBO9506058.1 hypothetical protein [Thalassospira sp. A3_1]